MLSQQNSASESESPIAVIRKKFGGFFDRDGMHELLNVSALKGGLTNETFVAATKTHSRYVVRVPGPGSEEYINREDESYNSELLSKMGIAPRVVYDNKHGERISRFLENAIDMTPQLMEYPVYLIAAARIMKKLHDMPKPFANTVDLFERYRQMVKIVKDKKPELFTEEYVELARQIDAIERCLMKMKITLKPCHTDTTLKNFMVSGGRMWMIDFEYAGNSDPAYDYSNFSMEAKLKPSQDALLLKTAFGGEKPDKEFVRRFNLYKSFGEYLVTLWCLVQLANGNTKGGEIEELRVQRLESCKRELEKLRESDWKFAREAGAMNLSWVARKFRT